MTARANLITEIREFLAEIHPDLAKTAAPDQSLFDLGLLDSLGIVSMVTFLEDRFGVTFQYEDLTEDNLHSLGTIADLVLRYTAERDGDRAR